MKASHAGDEPDDDELDFLTAVTGEVERYVAAAPPAGDQALAEMLEDDAVLAPSGRACRAALSAFEQYVMAFLDGQRPVARVRVKSGLSGDDLRIALGMLADKDVVRQVGTAMCGRAAPMPEAIPERPVDPKKARAAQRYQQALDDFASMQRARGLMFAKMAAAADPDEPRYAALVAEWAHLAAVPARKVVEPEWAKAMHRAKVLDESGDHDGAIAVLEAAIRAEPEEAPLHNRLGMLLATRKRAFSRASEHLIEAVEIDPNNAGYRNNLEKVLGRTDVAGGAFAVGKLNRRRL